MVVLHQKIPNNEHLEHAHFCSNAFAAFSMRMLTSMRCARVVLISNPPPTNPVPRHSELAARSCQEGKCYETADSRLTNSSLKTKKKEHNSPTTSSITCSWDHPSFDRVITTHSDPGGRAAVGISRVIRRHTKEELARPR